MHLGGHAKAAIGVTSWKSARFPKRAQESTHFVQSGSLLRTCAIPAEPNIRSLPQAPKIHRRRLSLGSPSIVKHIEGSLGSRFRYDEVYEPLGLSAKSASASLTFRRSKVQYPRNYPVARSGV